MRNVTTYEELVQQLPSLEWQKQNLYETSALTPDEKALLSTYGTVGFMAVNDEAKDHNKAPLNDIINKLSPLTTDSILYGIVLDPMTLPTVSGTNLISHGYLTLYMNPTAVHSNAAMKQGAAILKVKVPKGKKAVYYPYIFERELLFPHLTTLVLEKHNKREYTFRML